MNQLLQKFTNKFCKQSVPDIRPGYQVRVHQKIKEGNKERVQVFQGMVIGTGSGTGVGSTFTVRKISEGIGVEKIFPIHSPNIVKVEVQRAHKVRRAKLNFLRDLSGKALRLKEVPFKLLTKEFDVPTEEAITEENVEAPAAEEIVEAAPEVAEEVVAEAKEEAPAEEKKEEEKKED